MSNKVSTYNSYIYYKHHISQYIYIYIYIYVCMYFLPSLHILKTYQTLFQEHITKVISYGRYIFIMLKALLMEGNITHTWLKNQKSIAWRKSFKCMIKGTNLTNRCTRLDMLSLPPIAPIFPFQT